MGYVDRRSDSRPQDDAAKLAPALVPSTKASKRQKLHYASDPPDHRSKSGRRRGHAREAIVDRSQDESRYRAIGYQPGSARDCRYAAAASRHPGRFNEPTAAVPGILRAATQADIDSAAAQVRCSGTDLALAC